MDWENLEILYLQTMSWFDEYDCIKDEVSFDPLLACDLSTRMLALIGLMEQELNMEVSIDKSSIPESHKNLFDHLGENLYVHHLNSLHNLTRSLLNMKGEKDRSKRKSEDNYLD